MTKTKKKISIFWICFTLFLIALISFWIYVLGFVNNCLVTYENAQPEYVVEELVNEIENGAAEDFFTFSPAENRFEDPYIAKERFLASIKDKDITYEMDVASYNAQAPLYHLYADGELFAHITLKEVNSYPLMFILTVQEWDVASATPLLDSPGESVTIQVPDHFTVTVNDVPVSSEELTGNEWDIELLEYAKEYTTVPKIIEYQITDLFYVPEVKICDFSGAEVSYTTEGNVISATEFHPTEMDSKLAASVLQNAKDYSNFFSKDLPGCRASIDPISHMFPSNSYYLELAENYRLHDMWMYSSHHEPTFAKEAVTEYTRYSEDLFSCTIYFEKTMLLKRTNEPRVDITHTTNYYVNIDGNWLIFDMRSVVEN